MKELSPDAKQTLLTLFARSGLLNSGLYLHSPEAGTLLNIAEAAGINQETILSKPEVIALLKQVKLEPLRPLLLEFILHQSQVFNMIPAEYQSFWYPIVHDALLYFLDHLPQERLIEKVIDAAYLPSDSTRSAQIMAFVSKTPSLQKVAQILARNQALSSDYREALQQFENDIHTMTAEELVQFITEDVGQENINKYQVEFADTILAEGSVGAVIRATCVPPGSKEKREAIAKVIKRYALVNLKQELEIIEGLAGYFTKEHDFYQLGTIPLVEMFDDIKEALTKEINVIDEQHNLVRAREYYRKNKEIVVPELYPISTNHVTFMTYITGEKITSALKGQPTERAIMARKLFNVMTRDVIFSKSKVPIFHGDPHAGNIFHVTANSENPYQIALLDWGLYGTLPRQDRIALMQLVIGVYLKDAQRIHDHVGALLENGLPDSPEAVRQDRRDHRCGFQPKEERSSFEALAQLLGGLINEGYATKFNLNLFIKSQVTIAGILKELDPTLDQNQYLIKHTTSLVKSEIPKRLLFALWFPAWDSRNYRSLLSNKDLLDLRKLSKKRKIEEVADASTQHISKFDPDMDLYQ